MLHDDVEVVAMVRVIHTSRDWPVEEEKGLGETATIASRLNQIEYLDVYIHIVYTRHH